MKKNKHKLFFLIVTLLLYVFSIVFFFINKSKLDRDDKSALIIGQDIQEREDLKVEIINEEQKQVIDSENIQTEEVILEDDAAMLSVNEESEKDDKEDAGLENYKMQYAPLSFPLKKKTDPDTLRIGLMTDLHVQSDNGKGLILDDYYTKKINYFVEKMNNVFSPNFLLLNGDLIEGTRTNSEVGIRELSLLRGLLDRTTIKKYWVAGNHDLRSVSKKQWMNTLGIDYISKAFDIGNYRIIILDGNFTKDDSNVGPGIDYVRGKVSERQMEWLKKELETTNKKVIVFMHHPPLRDIDAKINSNLLYNARELQSILSQYGVLAIFSGHIEDLYYQEIEGVDYFVSPGMVKYPKYLGAFSEITIKGEKISIALNYLKEDGQYRKVEIEKE